MHQGLTQPFFFCGIDVFCGICGAMVPCLDLGILVEPVPSSLKGSAILQMADLVYFTILFIFFFFDVGS